MVQTLAVVTPALSAQQAFSVFFVCVAFTSDIICLLFIPVQWLFFAASTYVWVQYVWHTGKKPAALVCSGRVFVCWAPMSFLRNLRFLRALLGLVVSLI